MITNDERTTSATEVARPSIPPATTPLQVATAHRSAGAPYPPADVPVMVAAALSHVRNGIWHKVWVLCPFCAAVHTAQWLREDQQRTAKAAPCGPGRYYRPVWPPKTAGHEHRYEDLSVRELDR